MNTVTPELYWISGSAPSWRVMLALNLKGIGFTSRRLDNSRKEQKAPDYLRLSPRGQVPLLKIGDVVVTESIAILAFLDRQWPERPIFGTTPEEAAVIWRRVMDFDANQGPFLNVVAQILFRGQLPARLEALAAATETAAEELSGIEEMLSRQDYLAGDGPSAADCMLYPAIARVRRAVEKTEGVPDATRSILADRSGLHAWCARMESLPGFDDAVPPHWKA